MGSGEARDDKTAATPPREEAPTGDRLMGTPRSSGDVEADTAFARGVELHRRGELDQAARAYRDALARDGRHHEALANLGLALRAKGQRLTGLAALKRAAALTPHEPAVLASLGNLQRESGELQGALASLHHAVELNPTVAATHRSLGLVLRDMGHLEEARLCFEQAIRLDPKLIGAEWDLVLTRLMAGDYTRGFPGMETRWRLVDRPRPHAATPAWDGRALDGRSILLFNEQGLGDAIQFARFAPLLKARGAGKVILEVDPAMLTLFRSLAGVDMLATKGAALPPVDLQSSLWSLPGLLGVTQETLPARVPYLSAGTQGQMKLPRPSGTRLAVGLCWAGDKRHKHDRTRSSGFEPFIRLLGRRDIAFYSLQKGEAAAEPLRFGGESLLIDLSDRLQDFSDTAAAIQQLDLVISVDTAVAHLSGALARPTWLLLPFSADWRWGVGRDDTPWYPHMHLFRQPRFGDWGSVLETVGLALDTLLDGEP